MPQRWRDQYRGAKHRAALHLRCCPGVALPGHFPATAPKSSVPRRRSLSHPQRSLALPIVGVLDIETRRTIKLHIDDRTGKLDFVDRARPLEQCPVPLVAGGIDDGLPGRRRERHDHGHRGGGFRDMFRDINLDRRRLDWRFGRGFLLLNLHKGRRLLHVHGRAPYSAAIEANSFETRKGGLIKSPLRRVSVGALEVERHACGRSFDGRAADRVVGSIARADLVAMAARTKTVVRARALSEHGAHYVPTGPVVEVVTGSDRILAGGIVEYVGLELADLYERSGSNARYAGIDVVEAQTCRIAGGLEGVSIGPAHGPLLPDELRNTSEHTIARPFIEGLFERQDLAPHPLIEGVELNVANTVVESIAAAHLCGPFVVNAGEDRSAVGGVRVAAGQEHGSKKGRTSQDWFHAVVAVTVDLLMKLVGGDRRKRSVFVGQSSTIGIAVGAVGATVAADVARKRTAGVRKVAAAATGRRAVALKHVAVGIVAVILGKVLAWREQRAELEAIPDRRFVPDRVVHAPIELGPVVAAGIAHDRVIVAERPGERIHRGGCFLVRRVGLAGLDRAPRPLQTQEAVARAEGRALVRSCRDIDLRLQLRHHRHAVPAIRREVMPGANSET